MFGLDQHGFVTLPVLVSCRSRVICKKSRHGAAQSGHKAKIEVAPGAKKALRAFFGAGGLQSEGHRRGQPSADFGP